MYDFFVFLRMFCFHLLLSSWSLVFTKQLPPTLCLIQVFLISSVSLDLFPWFPPVWVALLLLFCFSYVVCFISWCFVVTLFFGLFRTFNLVFPEYPCLCIFFQYIFFSPTCFSLLPAFGSSSMPNHDIELWGRGARHFIMFLIQSSTWFKFPWALYL